MPKLWTIGYERLRPESLAAELESAGVERLVDVRFRPQSRKPGMSKTRLGAMLAGHGIVYEHRRALGTPPDLRHLYKTHRVAEGAVGFRRHVRSTPEPAAALDALADELRDPEAPRTALMCLEEDAAVCHRRVLAEELAARVEGLEVVDL